MRKLLLVLVATGALAAAAVSTATAATPSVVHLSAPVSGLRYDQKVVHAHAGKIKVIFLNRSAAEAQRQRRAWRARVWQEQDRHPRDHHLLRHPQGGQVQLLLLGPWP